VSENLKLFKVGTELTKETVTQELSSALNFLYLLDFSAECREVYFDFNNVKKVDTLAVVFIVQIERFVFKSSNNLKIIYKNMSQDLNSLLTLTSIAQAIESDI